MGMVSCLLLVLAGASTYRSNPTLLKAGRGSRKDRVSCADLDRPFGLIQSHSPSAILSLPAFVSRSPPDNACTYPSWISRSLCAAGIARCINPWRSPATRQILRGSVVVQTSLVPRICASDCPLSDNDATIKVNHYPE